MIDGPQAALQLEGATVELVSVEEYRDQIFIAWRMAPAPATSGELSVFRDETGFQRLWVTDDTGRRWLVIESSVWGNEAEAQARTVVENRGGVVPKFVELVAFGSTLKLDWVSGRWQAG